MAFVLMRHLSRYGLYSDGLRVLFWPSELMRHLSSYGLYCFGLNK